MPGNAFLLKSDQSAPKKCVLKFRSIVEVRHGFCSIGDLNLNQNKNEEIASKPICPQCSWATVHRTKRQGIWERFVLYPLGYRAYRCELCDFRFLSRSRLPLASSGG